MLKKGLLIISIILCLFLIGYIVKEALYQPQLVENIKLEESSGDFIVHINIEKTKEGFRILRSLEYTGDKKIEIRHRSPLIEVMIGKKNPEFTGSPVTIQLNPGAHYHPEEPLTFHQLDKGSYDIFVHAQFETNEETIDILTKGIIEMQ